MSDFWKKRKKIESQQEISFVKLFKLFWEKWLGKWTGAKEDDKKELWGTYFSCKYAVDFSLHVTIIHISWIRKYTTFI